jgi:hypothetical protein
VRHLSNAWEGTTTDLVEEDDPVVGRVEAPRVLRVTAASRAAVAEDHRRTGGQAVLLDVQGVEGSDGQFVGRERLARIVEHGPLGGHGAKECTGTAGYRSGQSKGEEGQIRECVRARTSFVASVQLSSYSTYL